MGSISFVPHKESRKIIEDKYNSFSYIEDEVISEIKATLAMENMNLTKDS